MEQQRQARPSSKAMKPSSDSGKSWYHLNLFQKFALIFLAVVALPVILIAVYALQQSQISIQESAEQIIEAVTNSVNSITEKTQEESEAILHFVNEEFAKQNTSSLLKLKEHLIEENNPLYRKSIETLLAESQEILEEEFQALNREIAQTVVTLIEQFVRDSQMAGTILAKHFELQPFYTEGIEQAREMLFVYERFIHWSFFNPSGEEVAHITGNQMGPQYIPPVFTGGVSHLSSVLSEGTPSVNVFSRDGASWLRFFIPIRQEGAIAGVMLGIADLRPLWEYIHTQFFGHEEQVYVVNQDGTLLYPNTHMTIPTDIAFYLEKVSESVEPAGVFQQDLLMASYTTLPNFSWKIVIIQPLSSIATRIAPIHLMVSKNFRQLEAQLQEVTQQEVALVSQEMSTLIGAKQEEARKSIEEDYGTFISATSAQIITDIDRIAAWVHQSTLHKVVPVIFILGILAAMLGILVARAVIQPIRNITEVAHNISQGNVSQTVPVIHSHDEIAMLAQSFHETTEYLRNIAKGAQRISEGEFSDDVIPVSEQDSLGKAFHGMTSYLRDIATLVAHIAHGDLSQVVTPKSEADVLGNAVYRMTLYFQQIATIAKKVAGGNLSEQVQPQSGKDFLGNAFSEMVAKLRHLVAKIRTGADQLVLFSMETHSRAQEEAESVEKISISVEETSSSMNEMAATIGEVNERMKQLSSYVGESSSSIEELNSSIWQIANHGEQLAVASEETSTSIQQISASLQQIADTAQHSKRLSDGARQDAIYGRESVGKMIQSMDMIQQMVTVTAEAIQHLNKRTESIERILDVIKDISDQTSLLSINASIIAKKAGERGRGFNVIADKVRKLAEQSNSSAKEIARIIRDVRKESSHAVEVVSIGSEKVREGVQLAGLAGKALDKIISGANESSSVVAKIAETTDEQTKISHYIMGSMEHVVDMVNQIKVATKEQEQSSAYIMKQAEQVLLSSQQVKQSTLEQTEVVKHVLLAMDDIRTLIQMTSERAQESTQSASILSQHADALKHLVSQFTI